MSLLSKGFASHSDSSATNNQLRRGTQTEARHHHPCSPSTSRLVAMTAILYVAAVVAVLSSYPAAEAVPTRPHLPATQVAAYPQLSAARAINQARDRVEEIRRVLMVEASPGLSSHSTHRRHGPPHKQPYTGPLRTRLEGDTLVCVTPECARAAAMISASLNASVDPCDDFYEFACGGWMTSHQAPPDQGTFEDVEGLVEERLLLLLETEAADSDPAPLHMIRTAYNACMDTDHMDSLSLSPLWGTLTPIGGWPMADGQWNPADHSTEEAMSSVNALNVWPLVKIALQEDAFNTSRIIIYVQHGNTGIRETVLAHPDKHSDVIVAYTAYLEAAAQQTRDYLDSSVTDQQIAEDAKDVVQFEISLAELMEASVVDNITEALMLVDVKELQAIADSTTPGQLDYLAYLHLLFRDTDVIIEPEEPLYVAGGEDYVEGLATLLGGTDPRTVANYMAWMWALNMATDTTYDMRAAHDDFMSVYQLHYEPAPRNTTCTDMVNTILSFPMSRAYLDAFFPTEVKPQIEAMVEDLRASFKVLLELNRWLTPADRATAEEKLANIQNIVAYPDWIMDDTSLTAAYAGLTVEATEQFDNRVRIGQFNQDWNCRALRVEPFSRFSMSPTTVNAFYSPTDNSITILAAILQMPFYQYNSLAALNYGGIGTVIGHELSHGFDNSGRFFDKDGNLALWWSQESLEAFNERAQCFVDQYSAFHPPEVPFLNVTVNGQQTLGENIADNGGIHESFLAYRKYVARFGVEPRLPGLEEYTSDQIFFLANANVWCETKTVSSMMKQIITNVHSPGRFRVLGPLSNDEEFAFTWKCPAGSPMNRGSDRCHLW